MSRRSEPNGASRAATVRVVEQYWRVRGWGRVLAGAFVVAAVASACGGSSGVSGSTASSAADVVERYVSAVARKDFGRAMALKCPGARFSASQSALWRDQVDLFVKLNGRIGRADVRSIPRTGMTPVDDLPRIAEAKYSVEVGGQRHSGLVAATVDDHGKRVVCGTATTKTKQLARDIETVSSENQPTRSSMQMLVEVEPPEGYRQIEDEELDSTERQPGQQDGWTRTLQTGSYGGARLTAIRFDSAEHASQAMRHNLTKRIGDTTAIFHVAKPQAVGARVLAYAWLGIQAPDLGPYVDYVYATFDDVLVSVAVANLPAGTDHSIVEHLAGAIAGRATSAA